MPEGHTIHRLARDLNSTLRPGPVRASSPQGLFATEAAELDSQTIERAEAWGKHLFVRFANRPVLHIHLGLIGKLRPKGPDGDIEGQIRLRLQNERETWDLTGPMTCALVDPSEVRTITNGLGPDPLRHRSGRQKFAATIAGRRKAVAELLLDQTVIAGIGNVYRSEFCYLMGMHPARPADQLSSDEVAGLWDLAVEQLRRGVRLNRIVTRDPAEVGTTAGRIRGDDRLYVYKREGLPCHRCSTEIRQAELGPRKTWFCPVCQS